MAEGLTFFALSERQGKAAALNRGLKEAQFEIVVFSDASILLASDGLHQMVKRFRSEKIGCVSGEDYIPGGGGEGGPKDRQGFHGFCEPDARSDQGEVGVPAPQLTVTCPESGKKTNS